MTRVFTDGAEMGDTLFFDSAGGLTAVTTNPRSGAYCYYGNRTSSYKTLSAGVSEFYMRLGIRTVMADYGGTIIEWHNGTTQMGYFAVGNTNHLCSINANGTTVTNPSYIFPWSQYCVVELHVKIDNSVGLVELKVDGILIASLSGDTLPTTLSTVNRIMFNATRNADVWFDDIAMNNTSGSPIDSSWCGDGRVIALTPNATGDLNQLTPSSGSPLNNYQMVDEIPPNTTDYVEGSVLNEKDLYNLTACGLTEGTVLRVFPESRSLDTVAVGGYVALTIKTNGVEYDSTDKQLTTQYTAVKGEEYLLNPQTGARWTFAELDALQVGPKTRTAG